MHAPRAATREPLQIRCVVVVLVSVNVINLILRSRFARDPELCHQSVHKRFVGQLDVPFRLNRASYQPVGFSAPNSTSGFHCISMCFSNGRGRL